MTRREIREEIFKLLFEHELIDNNIEKRINDVINEVLEIAKKYSYNDTKEFLNGILAKLVKDIKEEQHK